MDEDNDFLPQDHNYRSLKALTTILLWLATTAATAQTFELRREHDSLYWLGDWRLPYPVYRFRLATSTATDGRTPWWAW